MDEQFLTCNNQVGHGYCREQIESIGVVTTCSHIICGPCADATGFFKADPAHRRCPACKSPLPHQHDAVIANLNPTDEYKTSILSGLDPSTIMECANRALSFWNYQIRNEAVYQQEVLNAMNERYKKLSHATDKIVHEANTEIENLHGKIQTISNQHAELQRKCHEIAAKDRERTKKYNAIRVLYDVLKKKVLEEQRRGITTINAEHAVNSMTTDLKQDSYNLSTNETAHHVPSTADVYSTAKKSYPAGISVKQLHPHQRSGSVTSLDAARMPPPQRPVEKIGLLPSQVNVQTTYRSPLPGAMRATANRAGASGQQNHLLQMSFGSGMRQQVETSSETPRGSRAGVDGMFSGISSGMKIGRVNESAFPVHEGQMISKNTGGHNFGQHRHANSFSKH